MRGVFQRVAGWTAASVWCVAMGVGATAWGEPAGASADRAGWAGPVEAEAALRFGPGGNAAVLDEGGGSAEAGAELVLPVVEPGQPRAFGAGAVVLLPGDAAATTGPEQYLAFELFYVADKDARPVVQIDETNHGQTLGSLIVLPAAERDAWVSITVNVLRLEMSGDRRAGSHIPPDGTALTRLGLWLDPGNGAGVREAKVRNVRLFRQDPLANAPVDAADATGNTALHRAAMRGDAAACRALLERGAAVDARNEYRYTPLALAVIAHDATTVKTLIEHGADVNAQRQLGFTPLYDAAAEGLLEVIELLLEAGADPVQPTEYRFEPLYTAVHHGHAEAAARLVADPRVDVNQPIAGFIPLHVAAQGDEAGPHLAMYEKLIELGAEVDLCSAAGAGDLARMEAILTREPDAAKAFTILGGWTPLHDAVRSVRVEAVALLLEHGADPNAVSGDIDYRSTPLHNLSIHKLLDDPDGRSAVLAMMLEAGAELNPVDKLGLTPLDRARYDGDETLAAAMLERGAKTGEQVAAAGSAPAEE